MRPKDAQTVIMLSGAILIAGGLILIGAQFWIEVSLSADAPKFAQRGANLEAAGVTALGIIGTAKVAVNHVAVRAGGPETGGIVVVNPAGLLPTDVVGVTLHAELIAGGLVYNPVEGGDKDDPEDQSDPHERSEGELRAGNAERMNRLLDRVSNRHRVLPRSEVRIST